MTKRAVLILVAIILLMPAVEFQARAADTRGRAVTPPPGSSERKLIMDALRAEIEKLHNLKVIFVVRYLKVQNGWAWIETAPQSPDGRDKYEEVSALLNRDGSQWKVAEIACTEDDEANCLGSPGYFKGLKKRFPGMPAAIIPKQ